MNSITEAGMITIYKFELRLTDYQTLDVPHIVKPLSVQIQNGSICVWAMVDLDRELGTVEKTFYIRGTGRPADGMEDREYLGTVQKDGYVWHVFMDPTNPRIEVINQNPLSLPGDFHVR